jgi:hypothetical protein
MLERSSKDLLLRASLDRKNERFQYVISANNGSHYFQKDGCVVFNSYAA